MIEYDLIKNSIDTGNKKFEVNFWDFENGEIWGIDSSINEGLPYLKNNMISYSYFDGETKVREIYTLINDTNLIEIDTSAFGLISVSSAYTLVENVPYLTLTLDDKNYNVAYVKSKGEKIYYCQKWTYSYSLEAI